jgi:hypothetical protein
MQHLHPEQQWEISRSRHAEMLREAKMVHLANLARRAEQPQQAWWKSLFQHQPESPTVTLETSAAPEPG